ncbi:serine/threonine protein kinase [Planctomycetia bacterium]|nr:serine/threonine protein kinase [Planctomycetia bacterium]
MKFTFGPDTRPLDGITIKRAIHRGGFGEVYYAVTDAGKEVALKLLHNNLEVELRGVSQCLNLKHPNLVTIFDIRQDAERDHWIVMEYVGGQSLHDALQQHPDGMPLQQVLNWLTGMTAGLIFLHDRGLVHRDLKPANIFSDGGVVKVGDVGLSKFISESRRSAQTQSVGTVYYMAPEVARGRYGREVDVYSLGIMLYEMMTGRVPFEGESAGEILMKHLTAEPDLRLLPTPLRGVLAAALEKDPERRIHDVETLQQRFREAVTATGLPLQQPAVFHSLQTDEMFPGSRPAVRQPAAGGSAEHVAAAGAAAGIAGAATAAAADTAQATMARQTGYAWGSLRQFWNEDLPAPVRWMLTGALLLGGLRSGLLTSPVAQGLAIGWLAWWMFGRSGKTEKSSTSQNRQPAAAARGGGGGLDSTLIVPQQLSGTAGTTAAPDARAQQSAQARPVAPRQYRPTEFTPETIRTFTFSQRLVNATTSMSLALVTAVFVTAAVFWGTEILGTPVEAIYFGVVTLLAAWPLILVSKLWEGRPGESLLRRLWLGVRGLAVGALCGVTAEFLLLINSPVPSRIFQVDSEGLLGNREAAGLRVLQEGSPTIVGFALFFCLLFMLRRWWLQADNFRSGRFRIGTSILTLIVGGMVALIVPFPTALGSTLALALSVVIQVSSVWTPPELRDR